MNQRLKLYKLFFDELVERRPSIHNHWVLRKGWPDLPENKKINEFIKKLSEKDKNILVNLLQRERDGGIHDVLVYLSEEINLNDLKLIKKNIELAVEPYGTELYWDWIARIAGDEWPEHQLKNEYKK